MYIQITSFSFIGHFIELAVYRKKGYTYAMSPDEKHPITTVTVLKINSLKWYNYTTCLIQ